jgi:hypothetical protein
MVEEETFFAWLDGELPADEAARVEAEVAADPDLLRRAAEHREMVSGLRNAFGRVEAQPVPASLRDLLEPDDKVVNLADARAARDARKAQPLWAQAAALAATLAIGIFAGTQFGGDGSSPIRPEAGRLVASAALGEALSKQLASAPAKSGPRIGLTYRDTSGAICRTFEEASASGLACREGGDWRIRSIYQSPEGQSVDYRMAGGGDPQLMEAVDASIDGEPFDAAQEKAAMEKGWR